MPNVSEVKTIFTVDLTQFVDGLKTMLSMTQTTGQQLNALLTVNAKMPDYTGLESQLKGLADRTKDYVAAQGESVSTNQAALPVEQELTNETGKSEKAIFKKADTLRGMRREMVMGMGAASFLIMSLMQLSDSADGASQKTSALTKGLKEAVPAGFGLAMMLLMLDPELGILAIGIGLVTAVGITLAKVIGDDTAALEKQKAIMDELSTSMKGADIPSLNAYRDALDEVIKTRQKDLDLLKARRESQGALSDPDLQRLKADQVAIKNFSEERDAVDKELTSKVKSYSEERAFAAKAEIDAIADAQRKELAEAKLTHDNEQAEWTGHHNALIASDDKYNAAVAAINKKYADQQKKQDEQTAKEQEQEAEKEKQAAEQLAQAKLTASDSWFERDLNNMRMEGLKKNLTQQQIDDQILNAQRQRLQAKLNELNKIIDVNDAGQIKEQANLANQISKIDAQLAVNQSNADKKAVEDKEKTAAEKKAIEEKETADKAKQLAARIQLIQSEIEAGAQQYDANVKLGIQMNQIVNEAIRKYAAQAAAAYMASTFESMGLLGLILAPAAGLAAEAVFETIIPKFAQGTPPEGLVVPPGYNNDNFLIGLNTGERFHVQTAQQMRNTYLPSINQETMSAMSSTRQTNGGASSGSASGSGTKSNVTNHNWQINISPGVSFETAMLTSLKEICRKTGLPINEVVVDTSKGRHYGEVYK